MQSNIKVQLLLTGNELMSGVTTDSNSARIAKALEQVGLAINRKVTVGDQMNLLVKEIQTISHESQVLIVNGGLGPTLDDLSAEALAKAFSLEIETNKIALKHVHEWCERIGAQINDANLKQAQLPHGVEILENPIGSAVGFYTNQNDCLIMFTPGVPSELEAMLEVAIKPLLLKQFPQAIVSQVHKLHCFGIGEARFQQKVNDELTDWPKEVDLSFRAGAPTLEIKLTCDQNHENIAIQCKKDLYQLFGDYIVSEGENNLQEALVALLKEKGKKITFAESCTGGKMASMLTEVSGSSDVFEAGFVTYSNEIKSRLIHVKKETLEQYGAVSEQVANEMLAGALEVSGADYGVAVSGIAGPSGGSEEKPVGTVCIAWGSKEKHYSTTLFIPRSRQMFQLMVAATGFDLIRRELSNITNPPFYFGKQISYTR